MKPFENKKELDRHCFRFGTSTYAWSITSAVRRMCGSDDPDRIGTQKEAALKRMERDENDVQKIITVFQFRIDERSTGVVLPADEAERLLAS